MKKTIFAYIFLLFCASTDSFSQNQTYVLDLGSDTNDSSQTYYVDSKTNFHIIFINLVPTEEYYYTDHKYNATIPPLHYTTETAKKSITEDSDNCASKLADLINLINKLNGIQDETQIRKEKPNIEINFEELKNSPCQNSEFVSNTKIMESLLEKTTKDIKETFTDNLDFLIISVNF